MILERRSSLPKPASNDSCVSDMIIDIGWLIHDFSYSKPKCFDEIELFSLKIINIEFNINSSKVLLQIGESENSAVIHDTIVNSAFFTEMAQ